MVVQILPATTFQSGSCNVNATQALQGCTPCTGAIVNRGVKPAPPATGTAQRYTGAAQSYCRACWPAGVGWGPGAVPPIPTPLAPAGRSVHTLPGSHARGWCWSAHQLLQHVHAYSNWGQINPGKSHWLTAASACSTVLSCYEGACANNGTRRRGI